jgi:hypothetical protein
VSLLHGPAPEGDGFSAEDDVCVPPTLRSLSPTIDLHETTEFDIESFVINNA